DFAQGDAELLVSLEDFRIDFVERADLLLRLRRRVIIEILVVDPGIIDAGPGRLVHFRGNEADGIFRQSLGGLVGLDKRLKPISVLVDVDAPDALDRLLY